MESATSMSALIESMSAVIDFLIQSVGDVFKVIQSYPVALLAIGIGLAFVAVKFAKFILGI